MWRVLHLAVLVVGLLFYASAQAQEKEPEQVDAKDDKQQLEIKDDATNRKRGLRAVPQREDADDPFAAKRGLPGIEAIRALVQDVADPPDFLRPLVNHELSFIKRVCDLGDDEMASIVAAAERAFRSMTDIVSKRNQIRQKEGHVNVMGPNNEYLSANPFVRIRSDAKKYLRPLISKPKYDMYCDEANKRDAFERDSAIDIAVVLIDKKLVLSEEQRIRLTGELRRKWQGVDIQWMQTYALNPNFSPPIPSDVISPILNSTQRKVWVSLTPTSMWLHLGHDTGVFENEQWIK